ncbi:MAG: hypothetical protein R2864_08435 [Syntrophotaleaceae bacterium]
MISNALTLAGMFEDNEWEMDGFEVGRSDTTYLNEDEDFQLYSGQHGVRSFSRGQTWRVLGAGSHWQNRDEDDEDDFPT